MKNIIKLFVFFVILNNIFLNKILSTSILIKLDTKEDRLLYSIYSLIVNKDLKDIFNEDDSTINGEYRFIEYLKNIKLINDNKILKIINFFKLDFKSILNTALKINKFECNYYKNEGNIYSNYIDYNLFFKENSELEEILKTKSNNKINIILDYLNYISDFCSYLKNKFNEFDIYESESIQKYLLKTDDINNIYLIEKVKLIIDHCYSNGDLQGFDKKDKWISKNWKNIYNLFFNIFKYENLKYKNKEICIYSINVNNNNEFLKYLSIYKLVKRDYSDLLELILKNESYITYLYDFYVNLMKKYKCNYECHLLEDNNKINL